MRVPLFCVKVQLSGQEDGNSMCQNSHHAALESEIRAKANKHVLGSVTKQQQLHMYRGVSYTEFCCINYTYAVEEGIWTGLLVN